MHTPPAGCVRAGSAPHARDTGQHPRAAAVPAGGEFFHRVAAVGRGCRGAERQPSVLTGPSPGRAGPRHRRLPRGAPIAAWPLCFSRGDALHSRSCRPRGEGHLCRRAWRHPPTSAASPAIHTQVGHGSWQGYHDQRLRLVRAQPLLAKAFILSADLTARSLLIVGTLTSLQLGIPEPRRPLQLGLSSTAAPPPPPPPAPPPPPSNLDDLETLAIRIQTFGVSLGVFAVLTVVHALLGGRVRQRCATAASRPSASATSATSAAPAAPAASTPRSTVTPLHPCTTPPPAPLQALLRLAARRFLLRLAAQRRMRRGVRGWHSLLAARLLRLG